ncbi:hypothetical protein [Variovorax sp. Sphag1AA]|uniref:hypothetical protein n=1 Tax=Variovorax sp. Sphag1AA TaxID=2587027 RepID=UPI00161E6BDA|nr:hypothetical protein [Variovorax sp. Sphag1AA]MBB3178668.1 hypothetical protein [Variovorax sp. Sphag1AA]
MRKILLTAGLALIPMIATTAFAQSSGEVDPSQGKARPVAPTTPAERSEARGERKDAGAAAARGPQIGEGQAQPTTAPKVSRSDRKSANAKRRAATKQANQAGELSRGGNTDAPERQKP